MKAPWIAGVVLLESLLLLPIIPSWSVAENQSAPDTITPIASSIKTLANVELDVQGKKLTVSIDYALQGNTLFPLPVWVALGEVQLLAGNDKSQWRTVNPDKGLWTADDCGSLRLRVRLTNLLAQEQSRKIVYDRLREEISQLKGTKPDVIQVEAPILDRNAFRVTLCASGSGRFQPAEVELSNPPYVPPVLPQNGGEILLDLLPANLAQLEFDKSRRITLPETYLRIEGSLKARFEKLDYQSNLTAVRQALTSLQNRVRSVTPSIAEGPEALVNVSVGGQAGQENSANAGLIQYLVGTINVREGSKRDLRAVRDLAERVLEKVLAQVQLNDLDDKKRVAMMLGSQVTVLATVGEIRMLAKQTRVQREQQLKVALDDWEARRHGAESEYKGSLGVSINVPFKVPFPKLSGELDARVKKKLEEEQARQRKETHETLYRGLDEMKKHFDGRVPTLTGIQFDQKGLSTSLTQIEGEVKENTFTTGWSHHEWPPVRLVNLPATDLTPQLLAEQVAQSRVRYEAFQQLLARPEQVAEFQEAKARLEKLEKAAKEQGDAAKTHSAEFEKKLKLCQELFLVVLQGEPLSLKGHTQGVNSVSFSPDGKRIVRVGEPIFPGVVKVWDADKGTETLTLKESQVCLYCGLQARWQTHCHRRSAGVGQRVGRGEGHRDSHLEWAHRHGHRRRVQPGWQTHSQRQL